MTIVLFVSNCIVWGWVIAHLPPTLVSGQFPYTESSNAVGEIREPVIAAIPSPSPTRRASPTPSITPTSPTRSASPTPSLTPTSTPVHQLPALYVDGPYLKRRDDQAPVWLKGINVEEFRQRNPHTLADLYSVQGLGIVIGQKWGVNLLRVAVDPETVESTSNEIAKLVDLAGANGMYVLLVPFPSAVNPARDETHLPIPDDLVATSMGYLAKEFHDRTNVIFGIWNEPHPDSIPSIGYDQQWQLWMNAAVKVAGAIRSNNPQAILVVPGGDKWARDLTYYQDHPFPFDDVIYDAHDYWAYPAYRYNREMWTWAIGKYPILIGEFGGDPTNPSDRSALSYIQDTLRVVNKNPGMVHYTMYALTNDGVWGIFTRSLSNMPKGNVLKLDLLNYPPTRFY